MNCNRIQQLISESYERRLSPKERIDLDRHLETCPACARFERMLRTGLDGVERLHEIAPSPELWETVHTRSALGPGVTPGRIARQAAGMFGAAVAVALVAALTIFLFQNHGGTTTNSSQQPQIAAGSIASPTATAGITTALAQQSPFIAVATPQATATPLASGKITPSPSPTRMSITMATPSPVPPVDENTAEETVVGYFHAINLQDYAAAYGYLGSHLQQQQSLSDFTKGYVGTQRDTLTITSTKADRAGNRVVVIVLDARQTDGTVRHYHGEYVVGHEESVAKIVDATVVEDVATPTPTPSADSSAQQCTAADLSATAGYQGATGSMAGSIVFTNTGSGPCTLQGTANVQILDENGHIMTTVQKTMTLDGSETPVTLQPSGQASLFFVWSNWCPPGVAETSAASPVPGGVSMRVTLGDDQSMLNVAVRHVDGGSGTLVPRCDAPDSDSTLSVGFFKAYPGS